MTETTKSKWNPNYNIPGKHAVLGDKKRYNWYNRE